MDIQKSRSRIVLGVSQIFIGIGAIPFGLMMIIDPGGGLVGFPLDWLGGSPFPNYLIPGIFLFAVNGLGSLFGAFLTFRRRAYASLVALGLGTFLIVWIVIQVLVLGPPLHWLQLLYFVLGVIEFVLSWRLNPDVVRSDVSL